jgi:hypothetical protein
MQNPDMIDLNIDFTDFTIKELLEINLDILNNNNNNPQPIRYASQLQFSKGYRRLYDWFHLTKYGIIYLSTNESIEIKLLKTLKNDNKNAYYFCLAGLIILFQVFSDGNHRTAHEYYLKKTGKIIKYEKNAKINKLFSIFDYYGYRINDHKMYELLNTILIELIKIYENT